MPPPAPRFRRCDPSATPGTAPSMPAPAPMRAMSGADLAIVKAQHWIVKVPLKNPIVWGSGVRTGVTRDRSCASKTAGGIVGWGESICLLDAIPAVLDEDRACRWRIGQVGRPGGVALPARARRRLLPPQARRGDGDLRGRDGDVGRLRQGVRTAAASPVGRHCGASRIEIAAYIFSNDPGAGRRRCARLPRPRLHARSSSRSATTSPPTSR